MSGVRKTNKYLPNIIAFGLIGFFFIISFLSSNSSNSSSSKSSKADGFTIEEFNLILDVKEDNKVDVTEEITVNWYEYGHHGIYRFIPTWLEYTGKDGKTIKRRSEVSGLVAIGEQYTTDSVGRDKLRVKIGSANRTLPLGLYTYTISYEYDMGEDPFNNFDEFIFHAFGDFWGTPIENSSIQINMPKEFDKSKVKFWADKERNKELTSLVDYYVEGNTLYARLNGYKLNQSLTVDIELPEGYFVGGSNNYGNTSKTISIIIIIGTLGMLLLWWKFGKDNEKAPETIEFYPPEDMDPSEIGYVYGRQTGKKLTIALIVGLASKGYIRIEEDEKKSHRKIIKENIEKRNKSKKLTEAEAIVYKALFEDGGNETDLSTNTTFYKTFDEISKNLDSRLKYKINDSKARTAKIISWSWTILAGSLSFFSFFSFADLKPQLSFLYTLSFIAAAVSFFLSTIMGKKTTYGEEITAKVLGFKDYLENAEKEQLELLVEKNANYFYDILPYAYVLNISKKWINKFENIPIPDNYMGNFDYSDVSSFDRMSSSIYYPAPSGSGSGGCSSCGGGCSSCGGGCSSCGGGGSW